MPLPPGSQLRHCRGRKKKKCPSHFRGAHIGTRMMPLPGQTCLTDARFCPSPRPQAPRLVAGPCLRNARSNSVHHTAVTTVWCVCKYLLPLSLIRSLDGSTLRPRIAPRGAKRDQPDDTMSRPPFPVPHSDTGVREKQGLTSHAAVM